MSGGVTRVRGGGREGGEVQRSAVISADRLWRYRLDRVWAAGPRPLWIMLNPSTADAELDDPTVRKVMGFTRLGFNGWWGGEAQSWGGATVLNVFAYRTVSPRVLAQVVKENGWEWARGPENDEFLAQAAQDAARTGAPVVCAWGGKVPRDGRKAVKKTLEVVRSAVRPEKVTCLGVTARGGDPRHPLMLPYQTELRRYDG